jgi:hypothetical protein
VIGHSAGAGALCALLLAAAALEASRVVFGAPWPVDDAVFSHIISIGLAALWSAAAVALLLRDRSPAWATVAWTLSTLAPAAMVLHALFTRFLGSWVGLLFLPAAIAAAVLAKKTFDRGETVRLVS